MRARIIISDSYAQMPQDSEFKNLFTSLTQDAETGMYTEIFIDNHVAGNPERDFRTETMQLLQAHFCRIFGVLIERTEICHLSNGLAWLLRWSAPVDRNQRNVVWIERIEL